jgi:predicted NBD/HSP70 family sugar kinase
VSLVSEDLEVPSHGRLLDIIRSTGPVSRIELAERTGLTRASVSNIVRVLLERGFVDEVGLADSRGGKRRTMLAISPAARFGIGIHLKADQITYVVTNMAGGMVGRQQGRGARDQSPAIVVARIAHETETLIDKLGLPPAAVVGIGIVAPGPIDYAAGKISGLPTLVDWSEYPLREELSQATGRPVVVDKDATAAAIGEFWGGRVDVPLSFACLYMEQGIGSGIVVDGSAFRGSASNAGEIGHVSLDFRGPPCRCGNRGCLENFASPVAVVRNARASGFPLGPPEEISDSQAFDEIARLAVNHDPAARKLIEDSAAYVAEGAVSLVNMTDLDLVVLAGPGFAIAGAIYVEFIRDALNERAFARKTHGVDVKLSTTSRDAAAVGASALVLQRVLAPRA